MIPGLSVAPLFFKQKPSILPLRDFSFVHSLGGTGINDLAVGVSFGAVDPDRYIIVVTTFNGQTTGTTVGSVTSATIGGVPATISQGVTSSTYYQTSIAIAKVPTGTSGSVNLVTTGTVAVASSRVYRVLSLKSLSKVSSASAGASNTASLLRPEGGMILGTWVGSWSTVGSRTTTWTNLTKEADVTSGNGRHAAFAYSPIGVEQSFAVTATPSAAPDQLRGIVLISLN